VEGTSAPPVVPQSESFLARHQFLVYRLFSLAGLMPIGGYLVIHLITNATLLNGVPAYQMAVDRIHSLGLFLPAVEWLFIFLPLLFHAFVGWLIISGAVPNTSSYPYGSNIRYVLQRATGIVAFFFILYHVLEMHHLGFGKFDPEHASSSAAVAIDRALWVQVVYAVGILACVYHLSNGLWTWGITWGIWTSPAAQRRASYVAGAFGLFLAIVGLSALWGVSTLDVQKALVIENRMQMAKEEAEGELAEPAVEIIIDDHAPDTQSGPVNSGSDKTAGESTDPAAAK
jgi:succinate dehydrogenase / fumarate reductase, cytochrome b subunit